MVAEAQGLDWKWQIGIVNSIGECVYQRLGTNIRRITRLVPMPTGEIMFMRCVICSQENADPNPQFEAKDLVLTESNVREELWRPVQNLWEGKTGIIMPGRNGGLGPRPM